MEQLITMLSRTNINIKLYVPIRAFRFQGELVEGNFKNKYIKKSDKLCLRYHVRNPDHFEIEIYSLVNPRRWAWWILTKEQFESVKGNIQERYE